MKSICNVICTVIAAAFMVYAIYASYDNGECRNIGGVRVMVSGGHVCVAPQLKAKP